MRLMDKCLCGCDWCTPHPPRPINGVQDYGIHSLSGVSLFTRAFSLFVSRYAGCPSNLNHILFLFSELAAVWYAVAHKIPLYWSVRILLFAGFTRGFSAYENTPHRPHCSIPNGRILATGR